MAISNHKRLLFLLLLVLIAFGLYRYLAKPEVKGPPEMTVPVSVARAIAQDVPHYLQGIGTVQASADVLVTSRVVSLSQAGWAEPSWTSISRKARG